jgi:hypothetical protein
MGSKLDLVKEYHEAAWANPPASFQETGMKYLSDDFHNYDADGTVVGDREAYIGLSLLLANAFTGFKAVYGEMREEGDDVLLTSHFEGTHTGDLDFSALGVGVIPASGKMIVWPDTTNVFTVINDQIVSIKPFGDSGGMAAFLEPLGVTMPSE